MPSGESRCTPRYVRCPVRTHALGMILGSCAEAVYVAVVLAWRTVERRYTRPLRRDARDVRASHLIPALQPSRLLLPLYPNQLLLSSLVRLTAMICIVPVIRVIPYHRGLLCRPIHKPTIFNQLTMSSEFTIYLRLHSIFSLHWIKYPP